MTPVPSLAGLSNTSPLPKRPRLWCGIVVPRVWMRRRFFLAASIPLRIAEGTSLALPIPYPTTFAAGSPTTTRAEKLIFLPPLTTFVTRLIETTCSFRFKELGSIRFSSALNAMPLKLQSRFARRVGEGFDTAVIQVTAPVEHGFLQILGLSAFGDQLANGPRPGDIAAALHAGRLVDRRSRHQRMAFSVVDNLRVDICHAAENSQAGALFRSFDLAPDSHMDPPTDIVFGNLLYHLAPFAPAPVLPAFFRNTSPV